MAARWEHVNRITHELLLPGSITKTGRARRVAIPPQLWEIITTGPQHRERIWFRWRHGSNGRGELEAVPWTKTTLRRAWEATCSRAGVPGLWVHDLRRSMASWAQERGHSSSAVQSAGGWEDPAVMARHYSHASRAAVEAVGTDLETMLEAVGTVGSGGKASSHNLRIVR